MEVAAEAFRIREARHILATTDADMDAIEGEMKDDARTRSRRCAPTTSR